MAGALVAFIAAVLFVSAGGFYWRARRVLAATVVRQQSVEVIHTHRRVVTVGATSVVSARALTVLPLEGVAEVVRRDLSMELTKTLMASGAMTLEWSDDRDTGGRLYRAEFRVVV